MIKIGKLVLFGKVSQLTGFSKPDVVRIHDAAYSTAVKELKAGNKIVLGDFGSMLLKQRNARTGRNPMTGQSIAIPAKKVVRFRPAKKFRQDLDIISKPIKPASSGKGGK